MIDRKKVIKGLEAILEETADMFYRSTVQDALALLKAQEPDEDWISRKRLRDEIQYYIEEADWGDEVNKVLGWCLEFIDNQEAVKIE